MATAKKSTPRKRVPPKSAKPVMPPVEDEVDIDDLVDEMEAEGAEGNTPPPLPKHKREYSSGDRKLAELLARLDKSKPVFPYPDLLPENHKPFWLQMVNSKPHDFFDNGDVMLLRLYCRVCADLQRLDTEIEEEGDVVPNNRGNPIVNPKVVVRSIAETRLMTLTSKLLSQPSSRGSNLNQGHANKQRKKAMDAERAPVDDGDDDGLIPMYQAPRDNGQHVN